MIQKFIKQNKLISVVIVVGIIAVLYLYLGPSDTSSTTSSTQKTTIVASDDTTQDSADDVEDNTSVHFPRYVGSSRDPFIPGVVLDNPDSGGPGSLINGGKWDLTGIESINGVTSALVENSSTQQSVFLQVGDRWSGLRVASINDDSVNLINPLGQVTQLGFPAPAAPPLTPGGAVSPGGGYGFFGSNAPSISQINPLPPLNPNADIQSQPTFGRFRGQQ